MKKAYQIHFNESEFIDLQQRVNNSRLYQDSINNWKLGTPSTILRDVLKYWVNDYCWQKTEEELNHYPQYLCDINGLEIHFFYLTSTKKNAPTVLMCHGWPDSFLRYTKTFPFLKDFNLVVPSMPGFTFSELPSKGGLIILKSQAYGIYL